MNSKMLLSLMTLLECLFLEKWDDMDKLTSEPRKYFIRQTGAVDRDNYHEA